MSNQEATTYPSSFPPVEEAYKAIKLVPNSDGSFTRLDSDVPTVPASPAIDSSDSTHQLALSKDIPLNTATKTFIRLFRPRNLAPGTKIPLIIYFHGGGMVLLSATSVIFHETGNRLAAGIPALFASVEYRLAPEHRLPAAYEDAVDAILWAKNQASGGGDVDPWVKECADFSRVLVMGSSAGANITYHAALRTLDLDLLPIKIVGLILNQPFFGGVRRTESELKHWNDPVVATHVCDLLWSLALPEGADRGHEYCDPLARGSNDEKIGRLPVSLVRGYAGDPLVDRQKEFANKMEARGVRVVRQFLDKGQHAVEVFDPTFAEALYNDIKGFVRSIASE